jgi:hypothetical protein
MDEFQVRLSELLIEGRREENLCARVFVSSDLRAGFLDY